MPAAPAQAGLGPATVARDWCKDKTLHYLNRRGLNPYNWRATTFIEGEDYVTRGVWSVDADEITVECTTPQRGSHRAGKIKIDGVEVPGGRKSRTPAARR
jgi:hypothetical protein